MRGLLAVLDDFDVHGVAVARFLVNGVTGRVSGKAPFSWPKIAAAILAALLVVVLLSRLG